MWISTSVLSEIENSIGCIIPETGGIIAEKDGIICRFVYDIKGSSSSTIYCPNVEFLNSVINDLYEDNIHFCGIVHSHGNSDFTLSKKDIDFARAILSNNQDILREVYFPIVSPKTANNKFTIRAYKIDYNSVKIEKINYI